MRANRPLRPFGDCLLQIVVVLFALSSAGCLRVGYGREARDAKLDAATDDAAPFSGGGRGGGGGSDASASGGSDAGGNAGTSADSGTREDAGDGDDSGAEVEPPTDAGTDGGTAPRDAGAADGGEIIVSPLCPERPGVAFCDGFEDPDLARWDYTVLNNGTLTRTTARVRSGTASLLATTGPPAEGTVARWATKVLANQRSGDAWLRFYNWVPGALVVTRHFSVGVMSELTVPYTGFALRILPARVEIGSGNDAFPGTVTFPRDRWVCVELHVSIDPGVGVYEAYLDGALVASSPPMNTLPADGYTVAEVGVHYADPDQGPVEVYVDDVVVANTRIGCD